MEAVEQKGTQNRILKDTNTEIPKARKTRWKVAQNEEEVPVATASGGTLHGGRKLSFTLRSVARC